MNQRLYWVQFMKNFQLFLKSIAYSRNEANQIFLPRQGIDQFDAKQISGIS